MQFFFAMGDSLLFDKENLQATVIVEELYYLIL